MRFWIRQGEIDRLLNQLPRSPLQITSKTAEPINLIDTNGQNSPMPDLLREQRDALLDYAREPAAREKKPRTTKRPSST